MKVLKYMVHIIRKDGLANLTLRRYTQSKKNGGKSTFNEFVQMHERIDTKRQGKSSKVI